MGLLSMDLSAKIELFNTKPTLKHKAGVAFPRYFTSRLEPGRTPYDEIHWEIGRASCRERV